MIKVLKGRVKGRFIETSLVVNPTSDYRVEHMG
jgi:hypothetical protein